MEKKVSVIMPNYNTEEEYLKMAVFSILRQSYLNIELIIIDDGSKSDNLKVLKKLERVDQRITILKNETNKGIVFSLNRGLEYASGDYIFRMDSDDYSKKDRIKKTVEYMEAFPAVDIVGTQYNFIKNGKRTFKSTHLPIKDGEIKTRLLWSSPMCHPTVCFRKSSVEKYGIRYSSDEKAEDYSLWVECAIKGCVFANIDQVLLSYRIHDNQITNAFSESLKSSCVSIRNRILKYLNIEFDEREYSVYTMFAEGVANDTELLKQSEKLLLRIIDKIPEKYAPIEDVRRILSERFYHECLRATTLGNHEGPLIFKNSCMKKFVRNIILRKAIIRIASFLK